MDIIKIIDYIRQTLKTRQDNINEAITSDVKTLEDYKYLLGKLHGYNEIQQELTDLLKKQELYDDEQSDLTTTHS